MGLDEASHERLGEQRRRSKFVMVGEEKVSVLLPTKCFLPRRKIDFNSSAVQKANISIQPEEHCVHSVSS